MENINKIIDIKSIKKLVLVLVGTGLLTISAKIQTPLAPIPATMQTFAVMFLGIVLGAKLAVATVVLYLIEGLLGLPVFAKGGGYMYLMGPTSGYLIGFILGAFLSGLAKKFKDPIITFLHLLFSVSTIYLLGLIWLWSFMGFDRSFSEVFSVGAKPFLHIEIYKLLILTIISGQLFKLRKFI